MLHTISVFGSHIAISNCQSLSQSFADSVLKLAQLTVVDNHRFAIGILMLIVIVLDILAFLVWQSNSHFGLSTNNIYLIFI